LEEDRGEYTWAEIIEVVEQAAIASARWIGEGKTPLTSGSRSHARADEQNLAGPHRHWEGERDDAPMLYIGKKSFAP